MMNDANFELSTQTTLDLNLVVYHQMITHADGTQLAIETKVSLVSVLTAAPPAPCACIRIISYDTTSIRKVMRMSLVIRDVTGYRGVPYMARKLLKFPVRWRKFPCVNVRKIADA